VTKPKLSHRERIIEGMISASARYGYGGASVARVVRSAGVSRATFYENFEDKESCFLAAFRQVAEGVAGDLESRAADPAREIVGSLLAAADRDPAAARLVLIEALAGGSGVREEHARLLAVVEEAIDRYLEREQGEGKRIEIPARALLGGVTSVIAIRLFRGETGRLSELLDDLMAWLDAYAVPSDQRRLSAADWAKLGEELSRHVEASPDKVEEAGLLPRGRNALPGSVVLNEQRDRILAATARLARERGYAAMTVADVVAAAGVAREVFYDQFRSKEDAFLSVQALALEASVSITAGKFFSEADWPSRVWNSLLALLGYMEVHSDMACADLVEGYTVGAAAIRRSFDSRMAYTLFLEDGYRQSPEAERLPRLCSETIAGAINELFRRETVENRPERMLEIAPQIAYLVLAPFISPVTAMELVESKVAERGRAPSA
jgi:AcrR family transcriptional regulator